MSGIISSAQFNREFPMTRKLSTTDTFHGTIQGTVTGEFLVRHVPDTAWR